MFKHSPDSAPSATATTSAASLLTNDGTGSAIPQGVSIQQLVLTNLGSLLPAHISTVNTFEGRVKNKVILTAKNAPQLEGSNDPQGSKSGSGTGTTNQESVDVHDEIFSKLKNSATFAQLKSKGGAPPTKPVPKTVTKGIHDPFRHKQMSARERKARGFSQMPKGGLDYVEMLPILTLFQSYLKKLIGVHNTNTQAIEDNLLRVDLHGAPVSVVKSTNPGLVGQFGIVLKENMHSLTILTPKNTILSVMKRSTVFQIDISFLYPSSGHLHQGNAVKSEGEGSGSTKPPPQSHSFVLLYGDQLIGRPYARVTKKFRVTSTIELNK